MTVLAQSIKAKVGFPYYLSLSFLYIMAILAIFPPVRALAFFNALWPLVMIGWLFSSLLISRDFFIKVSIHRLMTYVFIIYSIVLPYISGSTFIGNRYLELTQLIIFYWGFELCKRKGRLTDAVKLIWCFLPAAIIVSVITISEYAQHPYISRLAKKDTAAGIQYMLQGVGGYDFVYCLVFLLLPLIYFCFNRNVLLGHRMKVVLYVLLALFAVNILLSNFATALFLVSFAIMFRFFLKRVSTLLLLTYIFIFAILFPFLPSIIVYFLDFALDYFGTSMNAARMLELRQLLLVGVIEVSMGARIEAFALSIDVFLDNFLLGIVVDGLEVSSTGTTAFGQHSFFIDGFALFGVVFGLLQIYVFMYPLKKEFVLTSLHRTTLPFLVFILAMVFFTINNAVPAVGFVIYFVYPVLNYYLALYSQRNFSTRSYSVETSR